MEFHYCTQEIPATLCDTKLISHSTVGRRAKEEKVKAEPGRVEEASQDFKCSLVSRINHPHKSLRKRLGKRHNPRLWARVPAVA